jgi:uncharacterized protein (DUF433 family)
LTPLAAWDFISNNFEHNEDKEDYPVLEPEDIRAALYYAHHMVAREQIFDRPAA